MGEEMQMQGEDVKAVALILDRMDGIFDTMLLRCAVQLNLFDIIHRLSHQNDSKGVTVSEIADALSSHPINTDHLRRVLRYVAHMGLLLSKHNGEQERYGLTRASELYLLDSDINGEKNTTSLRASVSLKADDYFMSNWHGLSTELFMQNNVFGMKHGGLFDGMVQRPELVSLFNGAMAEDTRLLMPSVLRILTGILTGEARSLVDVGGGTGTAAANIAKAFPNVRCAVLDLPHVVKDADPGLAGVVEFIGGDMFERVPSTDVVLLKRILHDWEDEDCLKILKRCKEAIPKDGGRVIIVEIIMDDNEDNIFDKYKLRQDLSMMFIGGKERSRDEWNSLLHDAGFYVHKITPTTIGKSVIEACPIK